MSSIKMSLGSREIVKYLRILTALSEDQGLFPQEFTCATPLSGDLMPSSGHCRHLHAHSAHKFMQAHTHYS